MEKLTRLKIIKYRHVKPNTELFFHDGFHALLGKNGTGKTTLLDLISIVISGDFSSIRSEEFDFEYKLDLPQLSVEMKVRNVRVLQARASQEKRWDIDAQIQFKEENKLYLVAINQRDTIIREGNQQYPPYSTNGSLHDGTLLIPLEFFWLLHAERNIRTQLVQNSIALFTEYQRVCRFDEALDFFELILGQRSKRLQHPPDIFIRFKRSGDSLLTGTSPALHPWDLSEGIKANLKENASLTACELTEKQVKFLSEFVRLIGASSGTVTVLRVPSDGDAYVFKIIQFAVKYPDGRYATHETLSYGQKRLLAFLYYLAANDKFVVADELADSFHHQWIETCMEKMQGRQCFLSSQNPILLDFLPIASVDDVQKTFIQCHLVKEGDEEYMEWRNTSQDEAESFYKDLQVGIQYISELLMVRGLW